MTDHVIASHPTDPITWRKSTRSTGGSNGSNCVEVTLWRKSTRSGSGGGNCIEVALLRKGSRDD